MRSSVAVALVLLASPAAALRVIPGWAWPTRRLACAVPLPVPVVPVRMAAGGPGPESKDDAGDDDSLYNVDFSLDATTVLALLGGAIAFNFFVLANL